MDIKTTIQTSTFIVALAIVLTAAIIAAHRVDRVAAWMLVPYLGWILYATSLNLGITVLNP